ncbi:MAG: 30S ribosomal protein S2 [Candidatus Micrarchaeia archaeon]
MADSLLIKQETYLEAGIHIGTKLKVMDMDPFIYRMRNDGLFVLDLRKIDERIRLAAKLLSQYAPEEILVVASRSYSGNAAVAFSGLTGVKVYQGRFIPGILTNVNRADFVEPKLILICDPKGERQAVIEAGKMGIATVGLCDTDNVTMFIDWVVPCNNKGRRSLALIFYLLAREYMMGRGKIASYDEFSIPLAAFEAEKPEDGSIPPLSPAAPAVVPEPESVAAAVQEAPAPAQEAPAEEAAPAETPAEAEAKHKKASKKKEHKAEGTEEKEE